MSPLHLEPMGTISDTSGKPLVDLLHSPRHKLLGTQWYGNLTGREVMQVAQEYLHLQSRLHYPLLLNDKSQATGDWSEAMDWLEYEWLPQAMKSGLRAMAYVFSPDMHNQLASLTFFERVRKHIPIQLFYDVPAAWQWLRTQPRPLRQSARLPTGL